MTHVRSSPAALTKAHVGPVKPKHGHRVNEEHDPSEFDHPFFKHHERQSELAKHPLGDWRAPITKLLLYAMARGYVSYPEAKVYMCMASHMDYKTKIVRCSIATIAKDMGLADRTVQRAQKVLVQLGFIEFHAPSYEKYATAYEVYMPLLADSEGAKARLDDSYRKLKRRAYGRPMQGRRKK